MKDALVSVVVPTRNSSGTLRACLDSIKAQSYKNIEVIVVDNNSSDNTKAIAKNYTDHVFNFGPERSAQRNLGAAKCAGKYLLMVDSDMELGKDVISACVGKILSDSAMKEVIIPEESFGRGYWAQCKRLERSFYVGVRWVEAARFFDKATYDRVGGYDDALVSGEDWDLSRRIESVGSVGSIKEYIRHNEGHAKIWNYMRKKYYYAQRARPYIAKNQGSSLFATQIGPVQRYRLFFSQPAKLFKSPLLGVGMVFMKTCEYSFGIIGYWSATPLKHYRVFRRPSMRVYHRKENGEP